MSVNRGAGGGIRPSVTVFFFFCLCCVFSGVLSQSYDYSPAAAAAGLKMRTTEDAVNEILKSISRLAFKSDAQKSMPDESGSIPMSFFGNIDYKITNIQARDFKQPEFKTTLRPDKVSVALTGSGFTLVGSWTYRHSWFGVSDSGSLNATVTVSSVNVSLAVGFDSSAGRPIVSVAGCSVAVGSVSVRLSGGASWFYNLFFTGAFAKSSVEAKVQANVCAQVRRSVDVEAAARIAAEPLQRDLGDGLVIDLGLVSAPKFGVGYVECQHNGTVFDRNNPVKPPIQPGPFPAVDESTELKSFTVWASDFVLGSAAHALYSRGAMRSSVNSSTLPPSMKWFLNTSCPRDAACAGNVFPQIASQYPNSALEIELAAAGPPMVSISPSGVQAVTVVNVTVRARRADGSVATVCTLVLTVNTTALISMEDDSEAKVEVTRVQPNVTSVANSTVGPINSGDLSSTLESLARQHLQTQKAEKTLPIPVINFSRYRSAQFRVLERVIIFSSDLEMLT